MLFVAAQFCNRNGQGEHNTSPDNTATRRRLIARAAVRYGHGMGMGTVMNPHRPVGIFYGDF